MEAPQSHINAVYNCISQWLSPDNPDLKRAIERTVDENLFGFEDIKHQILALKQALTPDNIKRWVKQSGFIPNSLRRKTVLCLHAGNLPLVGLQDLLAVMISGADYAGKLSSKDPYLLQSLIKIFEENRDLQRTAYDTELHSFFNTKIDGWLFSGSHKNAAIVENILTDNGVISYDSPSLIRTSYFSVAYIDTFDKETVMDLTEAVFRYGGAGCRSVAVVVSPFSLNEIKCEFTDYIENFWLINPQHQLPTKEITHRFALNKALGVNQAWLNDFLIEEGDEIPPNKFRLTWMKGNFSTFSAIINNNLDGLQSAYSTAEHIGKQAGNIIIEPLSTAQNPPVWWKPDGIDTLNWLQKNLL